MNAYCRQRKGARAPLVLVIDNYDSFTFNLVQYLRRAGAAVDVRRHDEVSVAAARELQPDGLVVSPGPGTPSDAGISSALIAALAPTTPTLGVCLGHQCIGELYGGRVVRAPTPVHGKTSPIWHVGTGIFTGLPNPFDATRYHSLIIERSSLPAAFDVTAETIDGLLMGIRHRELPIEGVQFHPESILTEDGARLLDNFVGRLAEQEAA